MTSQGQEAWIVSVDMGYGHQRAAYPLRDIARERIITANADKVISPQEKARWKRFQTFYEGMSRISDIPLVGPPLWRLYDRVQSISSLYPYRNLSRPTINVLCLDWLIRTGFSCGVARYAKTADIPFVAAFFVPALAAAYEGITKIFCIVTDVDINRIWVAKNPAKSPIVYLAPTEISRYRLLQYGVQPENIHLTGFPLPEENLSTVKQDLRDRLSRLDPKRDFIRRYRHTVEERLGQVNGPEGPITITYAVGGAGAQQEVAAQILESLAPAIREGRYRINLVAGIRFEVRDFFLRTIEQLGLEDRIGTGIHVVCALDKKTYFERFNLCLRETDILWTKPSELVFYTALGLPLLMTSPLGSHEKANRNWILHMGAGFTQENPRYAAEWLKHWIDQGMLAQAAFDAYAKAPRHGAENIRKLIFAPDRSKVELR